MGIIQRAWQSVFQPYQYPADVTAPPIDLYGSATPPPQRSVTQLTQESAMSIGAVYRGCQLISNSVSRMRPEVFRNGEQLPTPSFIERPDLDQPVSFFLEETVSSLVTTGNAYWRIRRNKAGRITNVEVLPPNLCVLEVEDDGRQRLAYDSQYLTQRNFRHLKLMRVPGWPYGLGPIQLVRAELEQAIDLREYAARWFSESGTPTGVLKTDQPLSEEWAGIYRQRWQDAMTGYDRTAVLGSGLSFTSLYLNPKDAQFLEAVQFSSQQIARMLGIPASLMSLGLEGSSMTYGNVRDEAANFLRFTLSNYVGEIEDAFSELLPRGQVVKLDASSLLRLNQYDRAQLYGMAIRDGWLGRDEVRNLENLQGPAPDLADVPGAASAAPSADDTKELEDDE